MTSSIPSARVAVMESSMARFVRFRDERYSGDMKPKYAQMHTRLISMEKSRTAICGTPDLGAGAVAGVPEDPEAPLEMAGLAVINIVLGEEINAYWCRR
jgi:hypothetical protein